MSKYVYDEESEVLSIYNSKFRNSESVEFSENIIFDLNKEGNLVALQILEASKFLNVLNAKIDQNFLSNLEVVKLVEREYRNSLFIVLSLKSKGQEVVQQPMPLMRKS